MHEIVEAFSDAYPAVKVTGRLIRQQVVDEWLDFGKVPIRVINGRNYATPASPVVRATRDGTRFVLHPVSIAKAPAGTKIVPEKHSVYVSLDVPAADREKLRFRMGDTRYHTEAPTMTPGQANLTLPATSLPKNGEPLRILVRRVLSEDPHPFELQLKVRPATFAPYGPTTRTGEVYFEPKPYHVDLID
jgi:hypothetical protein